MQVGLAVPDGVTALGGGVSDGPCPWVGAEDVNCVVLGVEGVVPKGAALYAPTTNRCTAATCVE